MAGGQELLAGHEGKAPSRCAIRGGRCAISAVPCLDASGRAVRAMSTQAWHRSENRTSDVTGNATSRMTSGKESGTFSAWEIPPGEGAG